MYIFNNIQAIRENGLTTLYIGKPETFFGKPNAPKVADLKRANAIGWDPDTPKDLDPNEVQRKGGASMLEKRAKELQTLIFGEKDGKIVVADDKIKIRGYGAGLLPMTFFPDNKGIGFKIPTLFFPQRSIDAPMERLVLDTCSGRTCDFGDSYSWADHMVMEGVEELTFICDNKLLVYNIQGVEPAFAPVIARAKEVTRNQAKGIKAGYSGEMEVILKIVRSPGSVRVVQQLENSTIVDFYAVPLIESKFSGLELTAFAAIMFPEGINPSDVNPYSRVLIRASVHDSEQLPNKQYLDREVFAINGLSGETRVFQNGRVSRESTLRKEYERKMLIREESGEKEKIPPYFGTVKAATMTKTPYLPFTLPGENPMDIITYGNIPAPMDIMASGNANALTSARKSEN